MDDHWYGVDHYLVYGNDCRIQREYEVYVMRSLETQQSLMARLNLELESGGNIRFEVGSPTDAWLVWGLILCPANKS